MIPEFLSIARVLRQGARRSKVVQYPGVKEGVYLWDFAALHGRGDEGALGADPRPTVFVRPEPWLAQYYTGGINFLDPLLLALRDQVRVVLLPRGREQLAHFRTPAFAGITVQEGAVGLADIVPRCDLFIGAGGTMTREMAVLGIPTISVYQSELLDVDRYLLGQGLLTHRPQLTAEEVLAVLAARRRTSPNRALLEKGREAYHLIKQTLLGG
jgi:predicted glycosyltransferase